MMFTLFNVLKAATLLLLKEVALASSKSHKPMCAHIERKGEGICLTRNSPSPFLRFMNMNMNMYMHVSLYDCTVYMYIVLIFVYIVLIFVFSPHILVTHQSVFNL